MPYIARNPYIENLVEFLEIVFDFTLE